MRQPLMLHMPSKLNQFAVCLFLLFTFGLSAQSQDFPSLDEPIPVDSSIRIGTLENGLKYYIRENKKPEQRAELRLVVKAGSILENEDQLGLAHFLEHMAFNGTKNFAKNELVSYLQSIGVKFGADLNAYTSFDETVYILPVPTDDTKILDQSFQILEDWAHNLTLDGEEIENERGVVIEEWRKGRGANQRMRDKTLPVILKDSRYADRLPIGNLESLEGFKHESLKQFYTDWYRPDLMAVIAVGDFEADKIESIIQEKFSRIEPASNPKEREQFSVPDHPQLLIAKASDPETTFSSISLYIKSDLIVESDLRDYYNKLLGFFFTGMLNQRLRELTQDAASPFIFAGTSYSNFLGDKAAFTASANVKEGEFIRGFEGVMTEVERVRRFGFIDEELDRYKKDIVSFYQKAYNERDKSPSKSYADEYKRNFLENEPIPGIAFEYQFIRNYLDSIDVQQINNLSERLLIDENRVVVIYSPENENVALPSDEEIAAVMDNLPKIPLDPYTEDLTGMTLMNQIPDAGTIMEEIHISEINVTELLLSNGAKVILKPTEFKNDEILMTAWSDGGNSLYALDDYQSASNADAIINDCGIRNFSPADLQKLLSGNTASVRPFIGTTSEGMNGNCTPKDIETMFQLTYLYFTDPNKDRGLFDNYIEKNKALYKNLLSNPTYYFYNESAKVITQNHPRGGQFPSTEDWDKIDFERVFQIYQERFSNAGDFTFLLIGNFDVDSIKPYLQTYLASLPASDERESWKDLGIRPPEGQVQKDFHKGTDPKSTVTIKMHGLYEYDRATNQNMRSLSDILQIILIEKIREEKSGVYGISAKVSLSKNPYQHYAYNFNFQCDPDNADTLTVEIYQILESIKSNGVQEKEFQKVIETQKRDMEVKIKQNGYWMGALKYSYQYGYKPESILDYNKRIDAVSMAGLKKTANKYLNFDNLIYLRLMPENQ